MLGRRKVTGSCALEPTINASQLIWRRVIQPALQGGIHFSHDRQQLFLRRHRPGFHQRENVLYPPVTHAHTIPQPQNRPHPSAATASHRGIGVGDTEGNPVSPHRIPMQETATSPHTGTFPHKQPSGSRHDPNAFCLPPSACVPYRTRAPPGQTTTCARPAWVITTSQTVLGEKPFGSWRSAPPTDCLCGTISNNTRAQTKSTAPPGQATEPRKRPA